MIAFAQGKIVPSGRTKIVQPFEIGVVRAIHVKDGETVKAGDALVELDPTISDDESRHLQSDLVALQLDVARLRAALADGDPLCRFEPPKGASEALVATQRQLLLDQTAEQRAKVEALLARPHFHGYRWQERPASHPEWRSPSKSRPVRRGHHLSLVAGAALQAGKPARAVT
jgi:hypothetical protein